MKTYMIVSPKTAAKIHKQEDEIAYMFVIKGEYFLINFETDIHVENDIGYLIHKGEYAGRYRIFGHK